MHLYIYDNFVNTKKYEKTIIEVETRITDLGLNGRIIRLGHNQNIASILMNEMGKGIKTVVLVGNDDLVYKSVNVIASKNIPLGIIPIGSDRNYLAQCLGIDIGVNACDVLASRRIQDLDLGNANNIQFIYGAIVPAKRTVVEIDGDYTIEVKEEGEIKIINLPTDKDQLPAESSVTPVDGHLDLIVAAGAKTGMIFKKYSNSEISIIKFNTIKITSPSPVVVDGVYELNSPVTIKKGEQKLSVIVGKSRTF